MTEKNDISVTLTPKAVSSVIRDNGPDDSSVKVQVAIKPHDTTDIHLVDGLRMAIDQAENVDASIDDQCNLTITSRDGSKKTVNVSGDIKLTTHKLDEYLYEVKYDVLDYDFAKSYFRSHYVPMLAGCSVVRKDNMIGRNLDWYYDHEAEFIVETEAGMGRYASKGFAGTIANLTNDVVDAGIVGNTAKILPFRMLDGINEKGVYASVNMLNNDVTRSLDRDGTIPSVEERDEICSIMAVRYILDKFASAQEAAEYIRDYVRVYPPVSEGVTQDVQIVVADKTGTFVLSFEGTETHVITDDFHGVVTNFRINGTVLVNGKYDLEKSDIEDFGGGVERANFALELLQITTIDDVMRSLHYTNAYSEGSDWLTEFVGIHGTTIHSPYEELRQIQVDARALYLDTSRDKADTWHTTHTIVYDLEKKTALFYTQQNISESGTFAVLQTQSDVSKEYLEKELNKLKPLIYAGL